MSRCTNVVHALRSRETGTKRGLLSVGLIPPRGDKMKLQLLYNAMRGMSCPDTNEIVCYYCGEYCFHSEGPGEERWTGVEIETISYKTGKEIRKRIIKCSIDSLNSYDHVESYAAYVNGFLVFPIMGFPMETTMSVTEYAPETHVFFTHGVASNVVVPGCVVRYMHMLRDMPKGLNLSYIQVGGFRLVVRGLRVVLYAVGVHQVLSKDVPRLEFFVQK